MKKKIHPKWYEKAIVTCSCGNSFALGSVRPQLQIEICSKCHPFYTGEMKYIDALGRVERFKKKRKQAKKIKAKLDEKKKKKEKIKEREEKGPKTLKEMLQGVK